MNSHIPKHLRTKKARKTWEFMCETYERAYALQSSFWEQAKIDRIWVDKEEASNHCPEKEG